jgi:Bacterial antitoxin of type II TA system, VapB
MRTTIRLDDQLLKEAKQAAATSNKTLTQLVEDSLRETLARRKIAARAERVTLPTFRGTGTLPGVDLDNSAALLDLMETPDADS